jgi:hypothetical protein
VRLCTSLIVAAAAASTGACGEQDNAEVPVAEGPRVTMGLSSDPIFSPDDMVICDRDAGFCADDWGISMEDTRRFLGVEAEETYLAAAEAAGFNNFDGSRFTFSSGVYCDVNLQVCLESEGGEKSASNYAAILYPERPKEE